jgi:mono/diheme cytochrome c family protein
MRLPVAETVPRGFIPFRYTNDPDSRKKAGKELVNPFLSTDEVVERGRIMFTTFCIHCHGKTGAGNGFLFTSGLYPLQPKSLSGDSARILKDGEIFHTITLGLRSMGAHGSQIRPDDRWKLVKYIRKLQEDARKEDEMKSIKPVK